MRKPPYEPTAEPIAASDHEEEFIRSFVVPEKQERWASLLTNTKRRSSFLHALADPDDLDERWVVLIPPSEQTADRIYKMLKKGGAPEVCHVTSEIVECDNRDMKLFEAIELVLGMGLGSIISCIPGRLAYYEGEFRTRFLLDRRKR